MTKVFPKRRKCAKCGKIYEIPQAKIDGINSVYSLLCHDCIDKWIEFFVKWYDKRGISKLPTEDNPAWEEFIGKNKEKVNFD